MNPGNSVYDAILSKIGLKAYMIWKDPEPFVIDDNRFDTYAPIEYLKNASLRDTDEVYGMTERVYIHRSSGMRLN